MVRLQKFNDLRLGNKLIIFQAGTIVIVLLILALVAGRIIKNRFTENGSKEMADLNKRVIDMIEVYNGNLREHSRSLAAIFSRYAAGRTGGTETDQNLDTFTSTTGAVATVFLKQDEDFLRVSTSLRKSDGTRAVGTLLDRNHPGYARIMKGESYTGPAVLFGRNYMTHYEPVKEGNRITGIHFIGLDFTEGIKNLKDKIRSIRFAGNGYIFIIEGNRSIERGKCVVHVSPELEGSDLSKLKDAAGMDITRIMLEKQNGTMKYSWKDKNSMRLNSTRHSAFNYYGDWDWIIATSVWEDDIVSNGIALRNILFTGFFLCAIIILLVLYWSVTRIITARFNELNRIVRDIAEGEGDLTARIEFTGGDEIGILSASFNSFLNDLEKMIADIISASTTLSQAVDVISRGNQNLSQRTVEQSSSLEEIVATLKESGALLSENTESAQKARDMTADGVLQAKEGDRIAGEAVSSINEIKDSSRKIMDVLSLINEITFQTNLLALNAAVEAARAGENGRGFAVVAGEVRSLATRSAAASKEIETIINDSMLKIEQGSSMVTDTGQVLVRISASTRESADLIADISASSIELSQGMNQIQEAVNILDTMTQQNAALVEETASSTEDMAERARQLLSMLRRFKVNTHSGSMPLLE